MIDLRNVAVVIDGETLLESTTVSVPEGGALVIRGQNGAGKSTLLRVIAGMTEPSEGEVEVAGGEQSAVASMIGMPPLATDLTVYDHVLLVATTWYASKEEAISATEEMLERLNLLPLRARFAHELSSGQKQLFALAMTLVRPAKIILLDEPEQRLDLSNVRLIIDILNDKRNEGAALVVATHSDLLAAGLADQLLNLDSDS